MDAEELIGWSNWIRDRAADAKRVGVALEEVPDAGWRIAMSDGASWMTGFLGSKEDALAQILHLHLTSRNGLEMVTRDISVTLPVLAEYADAAAGELGKRFTGDLASLTYATGIEYPVSTPVTADATAAIVLWNAAEGQKSIPTYATQVGVPWQRLLSAPAPKGAAKKWHVSYPDLLTRVIAKYSHEPVILRDIQGNDPLARLTEKLTAVKENADRQFTYDCLRLTAVGYDREFYAQRFGDPPDVQNEALDQIIPTVRAMVMGEYQDAVARGYAVTTYGRRLPIRNQSIAEVLWFILGGTVQDIIGVAQVTFANNGGYVIPSKWASDAEHVRVRGSIKVKDEPDYSVLLSQLAPLAGPLYPVPLTPTVVIE